VDGRRADLGRRSAADLWTVIALLVAITFVVLSIVYARRATSAAPATN
jgi:hypothetical protein